MTFNDLEKFILEYLESKLPDVPMHTRMEITETLIYKFALCNADELREQLRLVKHDYREKMKSARPNFPER